MRNWFPLFTLFSFFILHFSFVKAQDTTRPVIMSRSYYDSILNALKKTSVKQKDTSKKGVHDTVKHSIDSVRNIGIPSERGLLLVNDSANKATMKRAMDSAILHYNKADSLHKANRIRPKGRDLIVNDSANKVIMHHAVDSTLHKQLPMIRDTARPLIRPTDTLPSISPNSNRKETESTNAEKRRVSTGYIALNFGIGLPISDYATVGGASLGRNVSVSAEFPGQKSRLGWAFKFDYGYNGINSSQYMHNVSDTVYSYDQGLVYNQIPLGTNYWYYSLMAGICKSIPLGRITFDARMLIGVLHGTIPQTSYTVTDTTIWNNITVNRYKASANSFAFSFGLDARYLVLPNLSVLLNFDYLTARPTFQVVSSGFAISYSGIIPVSTHLSTYTQAFVLNNLTLGVAYTITAKKAKK